MTSPEEPNHDTNIAQRSGRKEHNRRFRVSSTVLQKPLDNQATTDLSANTSNVRPSHHRPLCRRQDDQVIISKILRVLDAKSGCSLYRCTVVPMEDISPPVRKSSLESHLSSSLEEDSRGATTALGNPSGTAPAECSVVPSAAVMSVVDDGGSLVITTSLHRQVQTTSPQTPHPLLQQNWMTFSV